VITTLGQFFTGLPRNIFFVSELEEDGSRSYYPVEDLEAIPGNDSIWSNPVVVFWMDEHTAIINLIKADGLTKVILNKEKLLVGPRRHVEVVPEYLYPVSQVEQISKHAREQAWQDFSCMQANGFPDRAAVLAWAADFVTFERGVYYDLTDNLEVYRRIYVKAYTQAYLALASQHDACEAPPRFDGMTPRPCYPREEVLGDDDDFGCAVSC
jgi:hypothetical protein